MTINTSGGKGSAARPFSVDKKTFESNWDRIFNNKNKDNKETNNLKENNNDSKENNKQ